MSESYLADGSIRLVSSCSKLISSSLLGILNVF